MFRPAALLYPECPSSSLESVTLVEKITNWFSASQNVGLGLLVLAKPDDHFPYSRRYIYMGSGIRYPSTRYPWSSLRSRYYLHCLESGSWRPLYVCSWQPRRHRKGLDTGRSHGPHEWRNDSDQRIQRIFDWFYQVSVTVSDGSGQFDQLALFGRSQVILGRRWIIVHSRFRYYIYVGIL